MTGVLSVLAVLAYQTVFLGIAGAVCYRVGVRSGFGRGEAAGMKHALRATAAVLGVLDEAEEPSGGAH